MTAADQAKSAGGPLPDDCITGERRSEHPDAVRAAQQRTAVVGAGIIGLLTAWNLRLAGRSVSIIDPAPASAATFAAAGMLAPISEVQYSQEQLWPLMTASRAEYPETMATLERALNGATQSRGAATAAAGTSRTAGETSETSEISGTSRTGYRETGTILLAADPGDREAVAELVAVQQSSGMEVSALSSSALRRRESSLAPGMAKAWDVPSDHQVDPRLFAQALRQALSADLDTEDFPQAGPPAEWIPQAVVAVDRADRHSAEEGRAQGDLAQEQNPHQPQPAENDDDGGHLGGRLPEVAPAATVTTADGVTRGYAGVVLSPGLGYDQIDGLPRRHPLALRPVYGDVLRLRVRASQLLPGETQLLDSVVRARVAGRAVYLVPRADGELVIGASSREDGMEVTHAGSVLELLADAATVLPAVREMELREIVTRARPGTPDDRPYLGALTAGGSGESGNAGVETEAPVVVATGFHRHGILLAPLGARLTAALITGAPLSEEDRTLLEAMDPAR